MIDTHQHLFLRLHLRYGWTEDLPPLHGEQGIAEYRKSSADCGISGTVFVEAGADPGLGEREAHLVCRLAEDPKNGMLGVVACVDASRLDFSDQLEAVAHPKLKGVRHRLHTEPDDVSRALCFRRNVAELGGRNLNFDLCVTWRQLGLAAELAKACPETTFILNHFGNPDLTAEKKSAKDHFNLWKKGVKQIAGCSNVIGKLSGITPGAPTTATPEFFLPYFNHLLDCFDTGRLVWGSDWPVCETGAGLSRWCSITHFALAGLSEIEQRKILHQNAVRVYRLEEDSLTEQKSANGPTPTPINS